MNSHLVLIRSFVPTLCFCSPFSYKGEKSIESASCESYICPSNRIFCKLKSSSRPLREDFTEINEVRWLMCRLVGSFCSRQTRPSMGSASGLAPSLMWVIIQKEPDKERTPSLQLMSSCCPNDERYIFPSSALSKRHFSPVTRTCHSWQSQRGSFRALTHWPPAIQQKDPTIGLLDYSLRTRWTQFDWGAAPHLSKKINW